MTTSSHEDPVRDDRAAESAEAQHAQEPGAGRYHHGDLKTALLDAAERLVAEKGVEAFSVADAARAANVSSAAPYRHFKDKADLLGEVAARGFERMRDQIRTATEKHPEGSIESLVASGLAYIHFVSSRPELFHLMWGAARQAYNHETAQTTGLACHGEFEATLEAVKRAQGLEHIPTYDLGTPLWSMVHGFASLSIGKGEFLDRDPGAVERLIDQATRAYLAGLKERD